MKKLPIIVGIIILIIIGYFFFTRDSKETPPTTTTPPTPVATTTPPVSTATTTVDKSKTVIGTSVEGRDIVAYHFGTGEKELLFVGGTHGGYSWNTPLVAYELAAYLKANPTAIPADIMVTIIPVLNPDGLNRVVGTTSVFSAKDVSPVQTTVVAGRFNANTVDLNRNFDCDWKAGGTWQNKAVSGGTAPFSEPESMALKTYVESKAIRGAVVWYSAAGGVYSSSCGSAILPQTSALTSAYAKASGYPAHDDFTSYEVTGDMVNWLAKKNIPAISVLLTDHTNTEWTKNKAGIEAVLGYFAN